VHIWVDADACPKDIKRIIEKAIIRLQLPLTYVANHGFATTKSPLIKVLQVPKGFDEADHEIVRRVSKGDIVVTQDIALAKDALNKGAKALGPRGNIYDLDTIQTQLMMRDFKETLRESGVHTGGPSRLSSKDTHAFASNFDKLVSRKHG